MKKNLIFIILLVFLIEIPCYLESVKGYYCEVYNLETDKSSYYTNEIIELNATWELDYNPFTENGYIQINIYDSLDTLIWNSSKYYEIGLFTKQWSINTSELRTTFSNYSNNIIIEIYFYFWGGELEHPDLKDSEEITIIKRIPMCQLIGFKDRLNYGEELAFTARFCDNTIENGSLLINQIVSFMISFNNSIIFKDNFTTNQLGIIEMTLGSFVHLNVGLNALIFKIMQNNIYNNTIFQYEILVEKNPVFINVINIEDLKVKEEDLIIQLYCYYFFNDSMTPLNNQSIKVEISYNQSLIFSKSYNTNVTGFLSITISQTILSFTREFEDILLILEYNGNSFLQSNTTSLILSIDGSKGRSSQNLNVFLIVTFSILSIVIPLPLLYRFKKERKKMLTEVIIKY
ncbi:MAG: hypothetical protein KGD58_01210 [Candidatus Lokiarchaeota archaeon]|nr:hypothetical protein [Candidatus Lokiarchaeota archaeon]